MKATRSLFCTYSIVVITLDEVPHEPKLRRIHDFQKNLSISQVSRLHCLLSPNASLDKVLLHISRFAELWRATARQLTHLNLETRFVAHRKSHN
jgi:hypothetical protein